MNAVVSHGVTSARKLDKAKRVNHFRLAPEAASACLA